MQVIARTAQSPEEYLYNYLKVSQLKNGTAIAPARLKGFTGILPGQEGDPDTRIAVIYYKLNAYLLSGTVEEPTSFNDIDKSFIASINTFRPISSREIAGQKPQTVRYVKATAATTFEALAKTLKLSSADVEDLRIINGYYPSGEPAAGEWIKIFKR
jgi:predicted Zn-dependent protease